MIELVFYNIGIHCRLSLDDGSVGESGSIQTQKMMLEKYWKDNHYTIKEIYIDDGVSGLLMTQSDIMFKVMATDFICITESIAQILKYYLQKLLLKYWLI